jgi:hypothetical protein
MQIPSHFIGQHILPPFPPSAHAPCVHDGVDAAMQARYAQFARKTRRISEGRQLSPATSRLTGTDWLGASLLRAGGSGASIRLKTFCAKSGESSTLI